MSTTDQNVKNIPKIFIHLKKKKIQAVKDTVGTYCVILKKSHL